MAIGNIEIVDDVALISIDDGKANAVGYDFIDTIVDGLQRAQADARAVVFAGKPGIFSAGFDLKEIAKGETQKAALVKAGGNMLTQVFAHPQPVTAACTGHAIAAGALMLLACDTRIGSQGNYRIGLNETELDLTLPVFATELALSRLPARHLTPAFVQAQLYSPLLACDAGYLDDVVEAPNLIETCLKRATQLAKLPAGAYANNKLRVRKMALLKMQDSLQ